MKCYICAEQGKHSDAVGVCIVCGMAVCREHMIREETPVWDGTYPVRLKQDLEHVKRIICPPCHAALKENYAWNMLEGQTWRYGKVIILCL